MIVGNVPKGIIGYVPFPSGNVNNVAEIEDVYNWAERTEAFQAEERPGKGPKGPRDKNLTNRVGYVTTVRAVLRKKNVLLEKLEKAKEYDGVIINPPVP
ncbi:hypothetical protein [Hymenobacter glacialis]|uniref:hypothetical protein n=1 Tax=Hymenobacter glacialis TaxID=1908236 RepID=UPI000F77B715|nr:hypothetical protein [Hymenobacter glacialis]